MNWIQFGKLVHSIYGSEGKLPDLEWIESLGLFAVKFGQVHALRIDFLEREKCEHLARLYRQNAAIAGEDFRALLKQSMGPDYHQNFASIDERALASASVGQVHKARLQDGSEVVIKVVKKDVRSSFLADITSLKQLMRTGTFFYPALKKAGDPEGILDDIAEYTLSELDLRNEVAGQRTLRCIYEENNSRFDLSRLRFAQVHESLCNENVMVSEFIAGSSFDELLEAGEMDYELLLELFRIHGFYMFCIGTFHGDMHPGNVLLSGDKLCFIDTGYIGHVGTKIRRGLFAFFAALSEDDYERCAVALNSMAEQPLGDEAMEPFKVKFKELYADFAGASMAEVSLTRKMMQTIKLGIRAGMTFERGIFAIIRSLMYLDGMVLRCKPDAVLIRDMRRNIDEFRNWV